MLSNQRFYYSTTKKAVVAFGSLFSKIFITRTDESGAIQQTINVPLTYANKNKWLATVIYNQDNEDRQFQSILPNMAFDITAFTYSPERKIQANLTPNRYTVNPAAGTTSIGMPSIDSNQLISSRSPAPYTLTFKLYIATKNFEDMLQIVEQILPTFNPSYSVPVIWIPELNARGDFPITLTSVSPSDSFEGAITDRREIIWTLTFNANVNYYAASSATSIIKKADIHLHANMDITTDPNVSYHVEPDPLTASATDTYSFMESWSNKD